MGVLPNISHTDMCRFKGYDFCGVSECFWPKIISYSKWRCVRNFPNLETRDDCVSILFYDHSVPRKKKNNKILTYFRTILSQPVITMDIFLNLVDWSESLSTKCE